MNSINLALGGGGPAGFAHIGVLRYLVESSPGRAITSIVGTSVGALMGALFSYSVKRRYGHLSMEDAQRFAVMALARVALAEDFSRFEDRPMKGSLEAAQGTLYWGEELQFWLLEMLLDETGAAVSFRGLGCELQMTAVNAETGDLLHLTPARHPELKLAHAVRASASIPFAFLASRIVIDGAVIRCWDGGLAGNCRFDLAQAIDPDLDTVASSLTYRGYPVTVNLPFWRIRGLVEAAIHVANILQRHLESELLRGRDGPKLTIIRPDVDKVSLLGFDLDLAQRGELIEAGWKAAGEEMDGVPSAYPGAPLVRDDWTLLSDCFQGVIDAEDEFRARGLDNAVRFQIHRHLEESRIPYSPDKLKALVRRCCHSICEDATAVASSGDDLRTTIRYCAERWIKRWVRRGD